jgi:hypothetical protein
MNHNQSSSMSKFLLSLYNCAYELEYSYVYIMFIVYELVLSSCAMFLIYSSLFFIVHLTYMNRSRIRDEMMVHWAVPVALNLACQSEGLGPAGVKSCFQIREHGVQVCGDQWICGYPTGRGVGGRVVTALSSFVFPHVRIFSRSHVKSLFAGRPAMGISLSSQT